VAALTEFAQKRTRRGYRKAWVALKRTGQAASLNRVHRLWKRANLQVKKRTGKKRKPPGEKKAALLVPSPRRSLVGGLYFRRDEERHNPQNADGG